MEPKKILFIRMYQIGDLVCTTPAIHAVRKRFPQAQIGILINNYTAEVVAGNPDIDRIYVYAKTKRATVLRRWAVLWEKFWMFRQIRRERYDVAIGCGDSDWRVSRYAFLSGAHQRIGYVRDGAGRSFYNLPIPQPTQREHEVVKAFRLLTPLGISGEPGEMVLKPDAKEVREFADFVAERRPEPARPLMAVAISARKERCIWPVDKFMTIIEKSLAAADILLLWGPGSPQSVPYPGDDEAAAQILERFGPAILAYPTPTLKALVAALHGADLVVTLDTANLHLAAALKKPLVALMPEVHVQLWGPWKTESRIIASPGVVADIAPEQVWPEVLAMIRAWRPESPPNPV